MRGSSAFSMKFSSVEVWHLGSMAPVIRKVLLFHYAPNVLSFSTGSCTDLYVPLQLLNFGVTLPLFHLS